MSERRYNQDEVAAIFERASETEATLPASAGSGLTLAEVHDIARQVGISPGSISHAAQSLEVRAPAATEKLMGLPIGVGRVVEFNRTLSEGEWELLVADLRSTFNAVGKLRNDGPFRQWSNGNLKAIIEPMPTGSRLRLQTMNGAARSMMTTGGIVLGIATATLIASHSAAGFAAGASSGIEVMALAGGGIFAAGALRLSGWARRRTTQFEEVIARITK